HLPDGAAAPPLRAGRLAGIQDRDPLLDPVPAHGPHGRDDIEAQMSGAAVDQHWTAAERGEGWRAALAGRRVTVVGLARRGVAACRLLVACRADVRATDSRPLDALEPTARELAAAGVRLYAGDHPPAAFEDSELVVLSPGVPPDQPVLAACRERGVP